MIGILSAFLMVYIAQAEMEKVEVTVSLGDAVTKFSGSAFADGGKLKREPKAATQKRDQVQVDKEQWRFLEAKATELLTAKPHSTRQCPRSYIFFKIERKAGDKSGVACIGSRTPLTQNAQALANALDALF